MNKYNRRNFLKFSSSAGVFLSLPSKLQAHEIDHESPHFFIQFIVDGGMDNSYLTDARPRSMTDKGLIQNYTSDKAILWSDTNQNKTLVSKHFNSILQGYKQDFSIINGIVMGTGFDGHDQNKNILLSGNAFGGDYYAPFFNNGYAPIDYLMLNNPSASVNITNNSASLPTDYSLLNSLSGDQSSGIDSSTNDKIVLQYLQQLTANQSKGLLSTGMKHFKTGLEGSGSIKDSLNRLDLPERLPSQTAGISHQMQIAFAAFKARLSRSAVIFIRDPNINIDAHAASDAKAQPELYKSIINQVQELLDLLKQTNYSDELSFFDVTTFSFSSEFGRTMRQNGKDITDTGTDHNPLSNTMLLGGKNIQGGHIIGASDLETVKAYNTPSKHHIENDAAKLKIMGKPFDFKNSQPLSSDRIKSLNDSDFNLHDYLSIQSVNNTIMSALQLSEQHFLKLRDRDSSNKQARAISQLLK